MKIAGIKPLLGTSIAIILLAGGFLKAQEMSTQKEEEMIRLTNDVRKHLLMLTNYGPFDYISFGIAPAQKGYTVILKGYASRPLLKDAAETEVKRIEAVDAVDNQIEVLFESVCKNLRQHAPLSLQPQLRYAHLRKSEGIQEYHANGYFDQSADGHSSDQHHCKERATHS
jgi:hypothetical protein